MMNLNYIVDTHANLGYDKIAKMNFPIDSLWKAKEEYENLLLQKATHEISNPMRIRIVRREIARIKTFIRQHELQKK